MQSGNMNIIEKKGVTFLKFKALDALPFINQAVSTRHGGVSDLNEEIKYLNLGFTCGDLKGNIVENYRRFFSAADFDINRAVCTNQTHGLNILYATEKDCGKGIFKERDYDSIDAVITDQKNIPLVVHSADCVPVTLIDTENKAVGSAHCGWRGTFSRLAVKTLDEMKNRFFTNPEDVVCVIGPCICGDCYEVSEELYNDFLESFGENKGVYTKGNKFYLDLSYINKHILVKSGVKENNITISDLCTCCNKKDLYSHRGLGSSRGLLASVIALQ